MSFLKDAKSRVTKTFARRGAEVISTLPPTKDVRPVEQAPTLLSPEPSLYSLAILHGLQDKNVYLGTVPAHVKARRRAKNKVARKTRAAQRRAA